MSDPSLVRFRAVVGGALAHLESRREEINDLNVFPVADGDTGDNMALTLQAVLTEVDRLAAGEGRLIDEIGRDEIVDSVARAALLGARGNSGVILSQLIRGAAEELISRPGELIDPVLVSAAMSRAAQRAYASVREPAEGTILTVMREMQLKVASELAHGAYERLGAEGDPEVQNALLADILERALEAGEESVRRGPDLLPVLREAGVVDAGGHALVVLFAGVIAALRGTAPPEVQRHEPAKVSRPEHSSVTYRYCTNFAVTGRDLDAAAWRGPLEGLGDSVLVVGDACTLKVHVHTDEPDRAMGLFGQAGEVSHVEVADMREQELERAARLQDVACGGLAVVSGAGMADLFGRLGVATLDGGPTLNPSTRELVAAIAAVRAREVVVFPNSPNVVMVAEAAAKQSDKPVHVCAARSQQTGLVAAIALEPDRGAEENVRLVDEALAHLRTGFVAQAAKDDGMGRFTEGDAVGYVDGDIVAWGEPARTLERVLGALAADAEIMTCIEGEGAPLEEAHVRALVPATVDFEHKVGGQPAYWWLLTAE